MLLNGRELLLVLVVLFDDVSVVVVKVALKVRNVGLEALLRKIREDKRRLPEQQPLVLDDPLAAVLEHLDASNERFGWVNVLAGGVARLRVRNPYLPPQRVIRFIVVDCAAFCGV